jgi:hypothetical protein
MDAQGLLVPGPLPNLQQFDVTRGIKVAGTPSLRLGDSTLTVGGDYDVAPFSGSGAVEAAPLVFAGYGIAAPDLNWDDYKDLDVKGALVVIVRGEPQADDADSRFNGDQPSTYADLRRKASTARDKGAAGLLILNNPLTDDADKFDEHRATYSSANFDIPAVFVKWAQLHPLIKSGAGHDLQTLLEAMDRYGMPASSELNATGSLSLQVERDIVQGRNLIGYIPGSDPALANQYIVIGAHYDHLGIGGTESLAPGSYGQFHVGADDNASGCAAVLSLAWTLNHTTPRSRHPVMICFFDAEEIGTVGSRYLVDALPEGSVLAMLNFDMVGRLRDNKLIVGGTGTASEFDGIIDEVNRFADFDLTKDSGGFGASDHMNFTLKKVPSLFFFTGSHEDYHKPSDTADKINYSSIFRIVYFAADVLKQIDNLGSLSYQEVVQAAPQRNRGKLHVTLGTIPSYVDTGVEGMTIGDVVKGGPAEKAGLKAGDVIIRIGEKKVGSIYDFMYALEDKEAGQEVEVEVLRGEEHLIVEVTLGARGVEQ